MADDPRVDKNISRPQPREEAGYNPPPEVPNEPTTHQVPPAPPKESSEPTTHEVPPAPATKES